MREPNSNERAYGDELEQNDYINGIIPFKTLLIALIAVLCVSLVIMICLFGSLRSRTQPNVTESTTISDTQTPVSESQAVSVLATVVELVAPLTPLEEPEIYASYTDNTQIFTDNIRSQHAILIDMQTNEVIAHKNGDGTMFPASMTKVMTLIVAYENITDFNEHFTITAEMTDPPYLAHASVAGFKVGESVPLVDIMYGIALPSGADATNAVAFKVAGSEAAFAELMNQKAEELGLENTHFVNASGLHDPDHYTTPHDMVIIMRYAMSIPMLAEIMSTYRYRTTPTEFHPRTAPEDEVMEDITDNRFGGLLLTSTMVSRMYGDEPEVAEVIAGKTGFTNEAHNCLASVAETPKGDRYLLVTGGAATDGNYGAVYDAIYIYKNYIPKS